jgi:hypothetical protein
MEPMQYIGREVVRTVQLLDHIGLRQPSGADDFDFGS